MASNNEGAAALLVKFEYLDEEKKMPKLTVSDHHYERYARERLSLAEDVVRSEQITHVWVYKEKK
jgi:hypothetical protein